MRLCGHFSPEGVSLQELIFSLERCLEGAESGGELVQHWARYKLLRTPVDAR